MSPKLTWEETVLWLRQQPDQADLVRACYYDDPLLDAARRFAKSEEWQATRALVPGKCGKALDVGAGRGISSYALACDGWQVVALEPDPSDIVGAGAIRTLALTSDAPIHIVEQYAENLPFADATFDLVYGRQVLHHTRSLFSVSSEVARVLKPGGHFIAVREHVISKPSDLKTFLDTHPLHRFYGGENALLLHEYRSAFQASGLVLLKSVGPYESPINHAPNTREAWQATCVRILGCITGRRLAIWLLDERRTVGKVLSRQLALIGTRLSDAPGRLYGFVLVKPA